MKSENEIPESFNEVDDGDPVGAVIMRTIVDFSIQDASGKFVHLDEIDQHGQQNLTLKGWVLSPLPEIWKREVLDILSTVKQEEKADKSASDVKQESYTQQFIGSFDRDGLQIGDQVDGYCPRTFKWYPAKVIDKKVDNEGRQILKIHFQGWNSKFDEWIPCHSERLAGAGMSSQISDEIKNECMNLVPWYDSKEIVRRVSKKLGIGYPFQEKLHASIENIEDWCVDFTYANPTLWVVSGRGIWYRLAGCFCPRGIKGGPSTSYVPFFLRAFEKFYCASHVVMALLDLFPSNPKLNLNNVIEEVSLRSNSVINEIHVLLYHQFLLDQIKTLSMPDDMTHKVSITKSYFCQQLIKEGSIFVKNGGLNPVTQNSDSSAATVRRRNALLLKHIVNGAYNMELVLNTEVNSEEERKSSLKSKSIVDAKKRTSKRSLPETEPDEESDSFDNIDESSCLIDDREIWSNFDNRNLNSPLFSKPAGGQSSPDLFCLLGSWTTIMNFRSILNIPFVSLDAFEIYLSDPRYESSKSLHPFVEKCFLALLAVIFLEKGSWPHKIHTHPQKFSTSSDDCDVINNCLVFPKWNFSNGYSEEGVRFMTDLLSFGGFWKEAMRLLLLENKNRVSRELFDPIGECKSIIDLIKSEPQSSPFLFPVDPVRDGVPHYWDIVPCPMDLSTILDRIDNGYYDDNYPNDFSANNSSSSNVSTVSTSTLSSPTSKSDLDIVGKRVDLYLETFGFWVEGRIVSRSESLIKVIPVGWGESVGAVEIELDSPRLRFEQSIANDHLRRRLSPEILSNSIEINSSTPSILELSTPIPKLDESTRRLGYKGIALDVRRIWTNCETFFQGTSHPFVDNARYLDELFESLYQKRVLLNVNSTCQNSSSNITWENIFRSLEIMEIGEIGKNNILLVMKHLCDLFVQSEACRIIVNDVIEAKSKSKLSSNNNDDENVVILSECRIEILGQDRDFRNYYYIPFDNSFRLFCDCSREENSWTVFKGASEIKNLLSWLNIKGIRENRLKTSIETRLKILGTSDIPSRKKKQRVISSEESKCVIEREEESLSVDGSIVCALLCSNQSIEDKNVLKASEIIGHYEFLLSKIPSHFSSVFIKFIDLRGSRQLGIGVKEIANSVLVTSYKFNSDGFSACKNCNVLIGDRLLAIGGRLIREITDIQAEMKSRFEDNSCESNCYVPLLIYRTYDIASIPGLLEAASKDKLIFSTIMEQVEFIERFKNIPVENESDAAKLRGIAESYEKCNFIGNFFDVLEASFNSGMVSSEWKKNVYDELVLMIYDSMLRESDFRVRFDISRSEILDGKCGAKSLSSTLSNLLLGFHEELCTQKSLDSTWFSTGNARKWEIYCSKAKTLSQLSFSFVSLVSAMTWADRLYSCFPQPLSKSPPVTNTRLQLLQHIHSSSAILEGSTPTSVSSGVIRGEKISITNLPGLTLSSFSKSLSDGSSSLVTAYNNNYGSNTNSLSFLKSTAPCLSSNMISQPVHSQNVPSTTSSSPSQTPSLLSSASSSSLLSSSSPSITHLLSLGFDVGSIVYLYREGFLEIARNMAATERDISESAISSLGDGMFVVSRLYAFFKNEIPVIQVDVSPLSIQTNSGTESKKIDFVSLKESNDKINFVQKYPLNAIVLQIIRILESMSESSRLHDSIVKSVSQHEAQSKTTTLRTGRTVISASKSNDDNSHNTGALSDRSTIGSLTDIKVKAMKRRYKHFSEFEHDLRDFHVHLKQLVAHDSPECRSVSNDIELYFKDIGNIITKIFSNKIRNCEVYQDYFPRYDRFEFSSRHSHIHFDTSSLLNSGNVGANNNNSHSKSNKNRPENPRKVVKSFIDQSLCDYLKEYRYINLLSSDGPQEVIVNASNMCFEFVVTQYSAFLDLFSHCRASCSSKKVSISAGPKGSFSLVFPLEDFVRNRFIIERSFYSKIFTLTPRIGNLVEIEVPLYPGSNSIRKKKGYLVGLRYAQEKGLMIPWRAIQVQWFSHSEIENVHNSHNLKKKDIHLDDSEVLEFINSWDITRLL